MKYIVIMICFIFILNPLKSEKTEETKSNEDKEQKKFVEQLFGDNNLLWNTRALKLRIYSFGKEIIPYLISKIDTNKSGPIGYHSSYDSQAFNWYYGYYGIHAAMCIEIILGINDIEKTITRFYQMPLTDTLPIHRNYLLYGFGITNEEILLKKTDHVVMYEKLDLSDMKKVKKYYKAWWELNKDKSLEEMRAIWSSGKRPLSETDYVWY